MSERPQVGLRLATFSALAAFAAANWVALVADPPTGQAILAALCAVLGAACLLAIAARVPSRWRATAAAAIVSAAIVVLAALALGLPARLLLPSGWSELGAELGNGIGSAWDADYPYEGSETWSRLSLLLMLAPLLGLAAALTFWPRRRAGDWPQRAGLLVLLATYGIAATVSPPSHPLLSGALLFALLAACLWAPSRGRSALLSLGVVAAAGLAAVAVAARLDASEPWLDYRAWEFGGTAAAESFDWNHSYGPLDWARDGRTLLSVRSAAPHYWRTEVLDHFNGTAWVSSDLTRPVDLPLSGDGRPVRLDPKWTVPLRFDVHDLSSQMLIGAGSVLAVSGVDPKEAGAKGVTLRKLLENGDSYSVRAYDPQPTVAQMRASDGPYPSALAQYGVIDVPHLAKLEAPSADSRSRPLAVTIDPTAVPLRDPPSVVSSPMLTGSPYGRVEALAHRLAAGHATSYGIVAAIQRYLRGHYRYGESPPTRILPLRAFLFRDRVGYCQQFSGAMALMLRMAGIPSRVVGGFAPGEKTKDGFEVSDFDAHSWVEVYFNGIGWVTFDPTPPAAPAIARSGNATQVARGPRPFAGFRTGAKPTKLPSVGAEPVRDGGGGTPIVLIAIAALIAASAATVAVLYRRRAARLRSLAPAALAELQALELERAVAELAGRGRAGITLRGLALRLRRERQAGAAAYATQLRDCLYGPRGVAAPGGRQRRAVRRALARRQGFRARVRSWILMPPGGPMPVRDRRPA